MNLLYSELERKVHQRTADRRNWTMTKGASHRARPFDPPNHHTPRIKSYFVAMVTGTASI
jgi:hypothetical protein